MGFMENLDDLMYGDWSDAPIKEVSQHDCEHCYHDSGTPRDALGYEGYDICCKCWKERKK